ncbi:HNH endonuclease [Kitasatospora purpeofusca]|uniref:HNH endonuclease n=1 Tax=Kitasatospora purpeofusca TaxID=67352 RepID=UPI003684AB65
MTRADRPCDDATPPLRQREQPFESLREGVVRARRRPAWVVPVHIPPQPSSAYDGDELFAAWAEAEWYGCFYCDHPPAVSLQIDHVIPLARGGLDGPSNTVPACESCNLAKGDRPALSFTPWAQGVAL